MRKKLVRKAREGAKGELVGKGFSPDNIEIKLHTKKKAIARDIASEARQGYDLNIMGRWGLSTVR